MTHAVHSSLAPWRVRASIYSQLLASGRAPTLAQLAHASEATQDEVREALAILAWNQQVVLQADGELLAAEPFSAVPTPFVVDIGAAWPAWGFGICCSLGIGAMAGRDARVTTHCGHCFRRLEIRVEDGRCSGADGAVAQFVVPADHAVDDVVHACSTDLLYCSAGHAAAWRERYRQPEGQLLSLGQTWRLAAVWYGTDRRDPCWRGWTAFEANEIFAALGLPTGLCPFAVTGPREVQARHFPADSGVIEDAATAAAAIALGSATGSVYPLPSLRDAPIRIRQGSAMGEPSDLFLREDEAGKLDIGGRVVRVSLAPEPAGSGTVFSA